jgi:hypothetical protein
MMCLSDRLPITKKSANFFRIFFLKIRSKNCDFQRNFQLIKGKQFVVPLINLSGLAKQFSGKHLSLGETYAN